MSLGESLVKHEKPEGLGMAHFSGSFPWLEMSQISVEKQYVAHYLYRILAANTALWLHHDNKAYYNIDLFQKYSRGNNYVTQRKY